MGTAERCRPITTSGRRKWMSAVGRYNELILHSLPCSIAEKYGSQTVGILVSDNNDALDGSTQVTTDAMSCLK